MMPRRHISYWFSWYVVEPLFLFLSLILSAKLKVWLYQCEMLPIIRYRSLVCSAVPSLHEAKLLSGHSSSTASEFMPYGNTCLCYFEAGHTS